MDLNEGFSPEEAKLAAELSQLAADPTPERLRAIMAAVREAQRPHRLLTGRWRVALAGVLALVIVVAGAVGALAVSSGSALPTSPNYSLRVAVEHLRVAVASPADREQLRLRYAADRIAQARGTLSQGDRSDSTMLLRDSRTYLADTRSDLGTLSQGEQGQVEHQLNQVESDQNQAETQLNQEGAQGGN